MAKLTRKLYKRKKIAFAAVILGGVALVSSGFAAFVLSQDKTVNGSGSINVGQVSDGALEMTITSKIKGNIADKEYKDGWKDGNPIPVKDSVKDTFRFDAKYGDMDGRAKWDGTHYEHLEIKYTVVISSATQSFDHLTITMAQNTWVDAQVAKKNIVAPVCYNKEASSNASDKDLQITVKEENPSQANDNKYTWTAEYSVAFTWGETFKGLNPTEYYDKKDAGAAISYNDMKTTIDSLFTEGIPDFTITFVAHAK